MFFIEHATSELEASFGRPKAAVYLKKSRTFRCMGESHLTWSVDIETQNNNHSQLPATTVPYTKLLKRNKRKLSLTAMSDCY